MRLPDLAPDISFRLLTESEDDRAFAFEAKRAAMGPHIAVRWGWDEELQKGFHDRHYVAKPFFGINRREEGLGTLSLQLLRGHIRFGEFYLFPRFQGQSLGTSILRHCLEIADAHELPVRLEHLHWNPVGSLYRRHGFVETGRSTVHVFMERPVGSTNDFRSGRIS